MNFTRHLLIMAFVACLPTFTFTQTILDAQRLGGEVLFDGKVNEPVWQSVQPLTLTQQLPNFGQPPTERSEVFLAYNQDYLYFAGRMYLSDSALYRPTTYKRDAMEGSTDYFGLIIDSFNDNENAVSFFTTPTGLRWDGTVSDDARSMEESISLDWNTFWDAAVTRTSYGWDAEMRIPWSSLRFQDANGEVVMGLGGWWYIAAKNELDMFPLIPNNWGDASGWKPSQMQDYRFRDVHNKKPLYLTPYVLAGYQQTRELSEDGTFYREDRDPKIEAGLDLKYSLTSNLTLDLSANTDFAQVEVDDQQVNLTRFNLFFPEKRQFFLERASVFDFGFEESNRLFYSRRIGINDEESVRLLDGARLQGRIGGSDLGFLNMQTASGDSLNAENFTVLRLRRRAFNQYSYLGAVATNRMDFKGNFNSVYGFDGLVRVAGDEYLTAKWAQSFENEKPNEVFSNDPARIFLNWERRRYDGFGYNLTFSRAGRDWSPEVGFEERENFNGAGGEVGYGWLFGEQSKLLRMRAAVEGAMYRTNDSGKIESASFEPGLELETKSGWFVAFGVKPAKENVREEFELGDAEIPVGEYVFTNGGLAIVTPFSNLFNIFCLLEGGEFYDGTLLSASLMPRIVLSSHLSLEGNYQFNRAKFPLRGEEFYSHIGKLKLEYLANTKLSVSAFLQYNSLEQVFVPNVRFRWNPKEGNDLYIVFNDLLNSDRLRETPHLPGSESRALVVKYTYTFVL